MINERLTVTDTVQRESTLELNHVALLQILRDAGYKIPDGATFRVNIPSGACSFDEVEIDFDTMVNVVWTNTSEKCSNMDNVADIVGVLEDPSLAHEEEPGKK